MTDQLRDIFRKLEALDDYPAVGNWLERRLWQKQHPQWMLRDLDRLLKHPGLDADQTTYARYEAAQVAYRKWCDTGTPMSADVLGQPTARSYWLAAAAT